MSAAIAAYSLELAVEWLEAGRALIWSQVVSLRTPLDELHAHDSRLAAELRDVQQQLQKSASSSLQQETDQFTRLDGLLTANAEVDNHRRSVIAYDRLLKQIRALPGFEGFLRPKTFETLIS